jgi:PAS domain S-box-containing protein
MRENPELFEFLQSGSLDGVWYWDLQRPEHEWMSPRFWEVFGRNPADHPHLAAEWQDLIHPDDGAAALESAKKHFADPEHPYDQVVRYRHAQGHWVWVRCRGIAIRDESGTPIRMLGAHTEVTAERSAQEQLEARNTELEALNRELLALTRAVSHDVRSPMRTLASLLEALEEDTKGKLSESDEGLLSVIRRSAERIRGVVDGILEVTQLNAATPAVEEVNVEGLAGEILEDLGQETAGCELEIEPLPTLSTSRTLLRQVLQNLISNALKFRREGVPHRVWLRSKAEGDSMWAITVEDNGIGVEPEHLDRIFKPFVRLSDGRYGGTGIGLSLVRRAAERIGATLEVESTPGKGSRFRLRIPTDSAPVTSCTTGC